MDIKGLHIKNDVDTNIVLVDTSKLGMRANEFVKRLEEIGILAVVFGPIIVRFTTLYDLSKKDVENAAKRMKNELK